MEKDAVFKIPSDASSKLERLRAQPKFLPNVGVLYTGVHDPKLRRASEIVINELIQSVENQLKQGPSKQIILYLFKGALDRLQLSDTEDRERACTYVENIMDCIGLDSSDGLLDTWLYGFDPTAKH